MKKKCRKITTAGLAVALATGLAATAKADIVETFTWEQGTGGDAAAEGVVLADSTETSSGVLTYDVTTQTVLTYLFSVAGAPDTFTDVGVSPVTPDGTVIADGDLHLGEPPGIVTSLPSTAYWLDGDDYGAGNENRLVLPGVSAPSITGDWVAVPEASTLVAGSLLLLPFALGSLRAMRKDRVTGLA